MCVCVTITSLNSSSTVVLSLPKRGLPRKVAHVLFCHIKLAFLSTVCLGLVLIEYISNVATFSRSRRGADKYISTHYHYYVIVNVLFWVSP